MTIAENIETTRMSMYSPQKTPANGEKKRSRLKSRTSEPPLQSQEKTVKFRAKKEKAKVPKKRHDSIDDEDEDEDAKEEPVVKPAEKPPPEFRNFVNDKK
jgi:hypothetical protein